MAPTTDDKNPATDRGAGFGAGLAAAFAAAFRTAVALCWAKAQQQAKAALKGFKPPKAAPAPTQVTDPAWISPSKSGLPASYYKFLGGIVWAGGLRAISDYFAPRPAMANGDFTVMMSEVDVRMPDGTVVPRVVAFAGGDSFPKALERSLGKAGVVLFRAETNDNHSEVAANDILGNDFSQNIAFKGGVIVRVRSAVMNNVPCSERCANLLTRYVNYVRPEDDGGVAAEPGSVIPKVVITTNDYGVLSNGKVVNQAYAKSLIARGGGTNIYSGLAIDAAGAAESDMESGD